MLFVLQSALEYYTICGVLNALLNLQQIEGGIFSAHFASQPLLGLRPHLIRPFCGTSSLRKYAIFSLRLMLHNYFLQTSKCLPRIGRWPPALRELTFILGLRLFESDSEKLSSDNYSEGLRSRDFIQAQG